MSNRPTVVNSVIDIATTSQRSFFVKSIGSGDARYYRGEVNDQRRIDRDRSTPTVTAIGEIEAGGDKASDDAARGDAACDTSSVIP